MVESAVRALHLQYPFQLIPGFVQDVRHTVAAFRNIQVIRAPFRKQLPGIQKMRHGHGSGTHIFAIDLLFGQVNLDIRRPDVSVHPAAGAVWQAG